MRIEVTTDVARVVELVGALVGADPVRGTVLGSILADLRVAGEHDCWCAWLPGTPALAARSSPGYPALVSDGWPEAELPALAAHLGRLDGLIGMSGPITSVEALAGLLARPVRRTTTRLFRLDTLVDPDVPGRPRPATMADRALLLDWYRAFSAESAPHNVQIEVAVDRALTDGRVWLWLVDGRPVSLAARRAAQGGSARIAPVYTPPGQRRHGYGSAATAAATRDILAEGAIPVLFTDLANPTSNRIYHALGYRPVNDWLVVIFT